MKNLFPYLKGDRSIWAILILLYISSILIVYSSTQSLAYREQGGNTFYYLLRQIFFVGIGFSCAYLVHKMNYSIFQKTAVLGLILTVILLVATLSGAGITLNEGSRWIRIPGIGLTIQTSDLAKLTLFIFLSRQLARKQSVIKDFKKGFLPLFVTIMVLMILIVWENMSTALLMTATSYLLLYFGGVRIKYLLISGLALLLTAFLVYQISITFDIGRGATWKSRVEGFLSPEEGRSIDDNFQKNLSEIAIANGGIIGTGLGNGTIKNFLPHSYSDYVYAIIIEESGLLGALFVLLLYLLFLMRCIVLFRRTPFAFGAFLALSFGFSITFQALINMGVNVGVLPVTGQTLPLLSMGGSSLLFTSVAIGIILGVSQKVDAAEKKRRVAA